MKGNVMVQEVSLDRLRGLIAAARGDSGAEVDLVGVSEGWEVHCGGHVLKGARGSRRVFRTTDAAVRYLKENVVDAIARPVVLRVHLAQASLI